MEYTLQFGQIAKYLPYFAGGAWLSLQIAFLAFCGGMVIGLLGAMAKTSSGGAIRRAVDAYVTFFTNTPQLVQIYFIFFALPDWGVLLSPYAAVLGATRARNGPATPTIQPSSAAQCGGCVRNLNT